MTKIEELKRELLSHYKSSPHPIASLIEQLESAIREQVVLDALPKREVIYDWQIQTSEAYNQAIDDTIERLTTREEVERPYVELLRMIRKHKVEDGRYFLTKELCKDIDEIYSLTDGK